MKLSEAELARYEMMAEGAAELEGHLWRTSGIVEGAVAADVGCGPGAVSAVIAGHVGPAGRVVAVGALVADGLATRDDAERWRSAFERVDRAERRPTFFGSLFFAFGRRPAA